MIPPIKHPVLTTEDSIIFLLHFPLKICRALHLILNIDHMYSVAIMSMTGAIMLGQMPTVKLLVGNLCLLVQKLSLPTTPESSWLDGRF